MSTQPARSARGPAIVITILLALALAVGTLVFVLVRNNSVLIDEWVCVEGEAPAAQADGTTSCFAEGSALPAGWTWDPLGNRPMVHSCGRSGWTLIESANGTQDCIKSGTTPPPGWTAAS